MSKHLIIDKDYTDWIASLSNRYRTSQIKAAISINRELLSFYLELGKEIISRQCENKYGNNFFRVLSRDLKEALPEAKCFSERNLYYISRFYKMYETILPQVGAKSLQVEDVIFSAPWGHHKLLIDKFFSKPTVALYYLVESMQKGWSRNTLLNAVETNLHLRQGKAVSNFKSLLPLPAGDLAQELTKDPYMFDFTNMVVPYHERELKEALLHEITKFLLELGEGFAYVGREYRLKVGET